MIKKFLCWLKFHRWEVDKEYNGVQQQQCYGCNKIRWMEKS